MFGPFLLSATVRFHSHRMCCCISAFTLCFCVPVMIIVFFECLARVGLVSMSFFRGTLFDEELLWGRALTSDDRFCFQCLRVPGEQQDKFLRWDVVNPCWSIDGTSCGCHFGTKIEAGTWYRNQAALADLPFQEGDEALRSSTRSELSHSSLCRV